MICPTCHQEITKAKRGRICSLCGKPIKRFHKWVLVDSKCQHRDCADPEMGGRAAIGEPLLGEAVSA